MTFSLGRNSLAACIGIAGVIAARTVDMDAVPSTASRSPGATYSDTAASRIHLVPCVLAGVEGRAACGRLSVFENRITRTGRRLSLKVVVLPARDAGRRQADPIFLLNGGPGLGAAAEPAIVRLLGTARDDRDVVLVDQRGTGASSPLDCHLYDKKLSSFLSGRFPLAKVRSCRHSLERRVNLTQYTTPIAADDLNDVRKALGYARINIVGLSYGSKLALVYLHRYEASVRSVTLLSVVTTAYPAPLPGAAAGDRALRRVFSDCTKQADCMRAYPDLEADFHTARARLDTAPAAVTLIGTTGLATESATLTRRAFVEGIWAFLYSANDAKEIPDMIHRAALGNYSSAARRIAQFNEARWPRLTAGAMLSIHCTEDVPLLVREEVLRAEAGFLVGAPHARELLDACAEWPRAMLPSDYREPVRSETPALLLSGELDPITSPEWAAAAAQTLPRSRHVVRPGAGHVDDDHCTHTLIARFIGNPKPDELDASCASRTRRSNFWVR